ncbi:ABC transporter substrate-binding protein [Streptomyces sp. TS71-3]|uniref:ABC transporter substrate-binding protein n=1 Tax=Streptomyces sp. TS71-3 TaxID=2733862 RepID=UPI001B17B544|nr:extracellular solute-binding protein [Streptomyces sp. TS71-3]GHJ42620.1 iron(III) ABC transporter iron (III)-binding protein [Streptomyces sp. TS71-3]
MRTRTCGVACVFSLLLVTGCGAGAADSGQIRVADVSSQAAQKVYDDIQSRPRAQQRAKAVQLAKDEGTLKVYTSLTDNVAAVVQKKFQKQFGLKISMFRANSETILQRIFQESQARKLDADAVESDFLEMTELGEQNILADYSGPGLAKVPFSGRFKGWTADRFNVFLPAWDTDLVKSADIPHSWEDLADPKYRGKLTLEPTDSDWYENVSHYWLTHGKSRQQVDALWKGIVANGKVTKGHTTIMSLLGAGQTPLDSMNYTYITQQAEAKGAPVSYRLPDGTNPIPAFPRPNGVGMLKGAQHPAAAWLFYDWMLNEGQKVLVSQRMTPSTKVPGDTSLKGLNLVPFDVKTLATSSGSWDKRYDEQLRGVLADGS